MKKRLKKLMISLIIAIMFLGTVNINYIQSKVYAADPDDPITLSGEWDKFVEMEKNGNVTGALDTIAGIGTYVFKAGGWALASLLRVAGEGIIRLGGSKSEWSIDSIIFTGAEGFDGVELVNINFFDTSSNQTVSTFRQNVAIWYYGIRNLAIVILLGILLYVGIRMAISTVASDEAKYKKMLIDWSVSLALVFVLHIIMVFTIELNNILVTIIHRAANNSSNVFTNAMDEISNAVFQVSFTGGWASLIVYVMLTGMTMIYLFSYIKRMLTIGFLIIIAPLITVTYSIDKMGDGKSQALNAWLKEFVFNVLIQPFHCIIYVVFVNVAIDLLKTPSLTAAILAVVMMMFMYQAEDIIRNIFNFQAKSLGQAIGDTALMTAGIGFLKKRGDESAKKSAKLKNMPNMDKSGGNATGTQGASQPSNTATGNINGATGRRQRK